MGRTEAQLEGYLVITTIQLSLCLNSDIFSDCKKISTCLWVYFYSYLFIQLWICTPAEFIFL